MTGDLPPSSSVTGVRVIGCRPHHMVADRGRAGKEQMIEGRREGLSHLCHPPHDRHLVAREMTADQGFEQGSGRRREFGHFTSARLPAANAAVSGPIAR